MGRVISPDFLGGGEFRSTVDGDEARRVFLVGELRGPAEDRMREAATTQGIPAKGRPHGRIPGLIVFEVVARPHADDPELALVEVVWRPPAASGAGGGGADSLNAVSFSVLTDLILEETIFDVFGRKIGTKYTARFQLESVTGRTSSITFQRTHRVEVERPTFVLRWTRNEVISGWAPARRYSGATNGAPFLGEPPDRWLCTVGSEQRRAGVHAISYDFAYNAKGWQSQVVHSDAGVIPDDVSVNNGIATWQVYPRRNFGELSLPPPP